MSQLGQSNPPGRSIVCPACRQRITVPQLRPGMRIDCDCGHTIVVPAQTGAALAERIASYGPRRRRPAAEEMAESEYSVSREIVFPIIMIVAGLAIWSAQSLLRPLAGSIAAGLLLGFFLFVCMVVVMLIGVLASAKVLGTNYGTPGSAVFKLAATAIFASAAFVFCASLDMTSGRGPITGWHAAILIYAVAFKTMFELDWQETLLTVGIIALLQALSFLVILHNMAH
jgi:hypothetical protein